MKFKTTALVIFLISLAILLPSSTLKERADLPSPPIAAAADIGNPAAAYCRDLMGYDYSIITDEEGSETGFCTMPDGQTCDQWDFYAGTCGADFSYCAQQGLTLEAKNDGQDPYAPSYSVCTNPITRESFPMAEVIAEATTCTTDLADLSPGAMAGANDITNNKPQLPQAPSSFDWRNENGQNWVTSVKDQALCGSCWSFATLGIVEASENIINNNPNLDHDLAEQLYVSTCPNFGDAGDCSGGNSGNALVIARDYGAVDEACMPYQASNTDCSGRCSDWASRLTFARNANVDWSPTPADIKDYVSTYGPVSVYMGVGDDYDADFDGDGIYRCADDNPVTVPPTPPINHGVIVVGYDDTGGYWIVKNSWGSTWNGDGYFKVGYGECNIDTYHASYVDTTIVGPTTNFYLPMIAQGGGSSGETVVNNPGFESGQDGSWSESSSNGWPLIVDETDPTVSVPVTAHNGNWLVWLGGDLDETSQLSQSISIKAGDAVLHYWYYIGSGDFCGNDFAYIKVNGITKRTYNLCVDNNTGGWVQGSLDLSSYAGQTVTLMFEVYADGYDHENDNSNFFLDDVSFKATRQVGDPVLLPGVDAALPKSE